MSSLLALAGGSGSLLELDFRVAEGAAGVLPLDLQWVQLNETHLTLQPEPIPGADPTDGAIAVRTGADGGFGSEPALAQPLRSRRSPVSAVSSGAAGRDRGVRRHRCLRCASTATCRPAARAPAAEVLPQQGAGWATGWAARAMTGRENAPDGGCSQGGHDARGGVGNPDVPRPVVQPLAIRRKLML
ncbi:MAG: hypothetical protein U1F00_12440 [Rhodoferax sp.]